MRFNPYFPLLLCGGLLACESPEPTKTGSEDSNLSTAILGTWEHTELEVDVHTYEGRDSSFQLLIREADWSRVYGMRPSRTTFTPDGKLVREHRMKNRTIPGRNLTHGLWKQEGDSLIVIEPNVNYRYGYELTDNKLVLTGRIDHDFDGAKDDDYRAVYRLVSRTN